MTTFLKKTLLLASVVCVQAAAVQAQTYTDGLAAMQLEEWDKAIEIFTNLTAANAADQNAWLSLGNARLAKGEKDKAQTAFRAAYDAKPEGAFAFVANGRILLLENKSTDADKQFDKATRSARKDMNAWRQIGESYLFYVAPGEKRPNLTQAEQYLKSALDVNSKDFQTLMSLGYAYKEKGDGGNAAIFYEQAIRIEPNNPLPLLMLGKVYRAAKQTDRAVGYLDKAIALNPRYTRALRLKAEYFYLDRKWRDSREAYENLVKNGDAVTIEDEMQLANLRYITRDCRGVSELVEKILQKDGSKNYLRRLQAYCDYEIGEYQRGLNILNEYFTIVTPDKVLPSDYEYLGKLQVKTQGDTTAAIGNLFKAIAMDSSRWALYDSISALEYARKNYCGSAFALKMYLDSVPNPTATNYFNLGTRYFYCKDDSLNFQKAEAAYAKVTEINPVAALGWLWRAKAAAKSDPTPKQIEENEALAKEYGKARESWEKWLPLAEPEKEKNKKDLITAYRYLSYVYLVNNEAEPFNVVTAKWLELDPENAAYIKEMQAAFAAGSSAPKTPGNGN